MIKIIYVVVLLLVIGQSKGYDYSYCGAPSSVQATAPPDMTLKLVQVVTRHGDRTTTFKLNADSSVWQCNLTTFLAPSQTETSSTQFGRVFRKNYINDRQLNLGTCFAGELTERGFDQHVQLGTGLRSVYVDTYKYINSTEGVAIRSTDVPRTLSSAQGHLQGLFPPTQSENGNIPVVDIFTIENDLDDMFENPTLCPAYNNAVNKAHQDPAYVSYMADKAPFLSQLSQLLNLSSSVEWWMLLDAFQVMTCHNQTYPEGITDDMVLEIFEIANWQWSFELNSSSVVRLGIGAFTGELVLAMQEVIDGQDLIPYLIYSGHDTTVGPLMASFSAYDGRWPPYASHVEIELWEDSSEQYYVVVKYQGIPTVLPYCGGSFYCPFESFFKGVSPFIPDDYSAECQA